MPDTTSHDRTEIRVASPSKRRPWLLWVVTGLGLIFLHVALAWVSATFGSDRSLPVSPIFILVGIELAAGFLFLIAAMKAGSMRSGPKGLIWIILVGACMRAALMPSTVMLEDDYYRYLWDGAVLAHGYSPFRYSPEEAKRESESVPQEVRKLARESGEVISRINHPHLRTIYPPVAQLAFAAAYRLYPWSLGAWRIVLLLFDVSTVLLVAYALRSLHQPVSFILIYWWNPLVVKEIINSAHMDVIVLPFVLASVILATRNRVLGAVALIALAMGVKIWPVVLLPVILMPALGNAKRLVLASAVCALICLAMAVPIIAAGLDRTSGFIAYGTHWEMNDAFYMLILWGSTWMIDFVGANLSNAHLVSRLIVAGLLVAWIAWLSREWPTHAIQFWDRCLYIVAAMFLLSPTQFPWYYVWVVPFLAVRPRLSLLTLSVLLPIYYLRFYFKAIEQVEIFDYGIVWIEFVPVWILLLLEWRAHRRHSKTGVGNL